MISYILLAQQYALSSQKETLVLTEKTRSHLVMVSHSMQRV